MRFDNMSDQACKAYNDAVRHAAKRAFDEHTDYAKPVCFSVWRDKRDAFYVRPSKDPVPDDARMVCIAQRWDDKTVQLRFDGAHSEWVNF